MISKISVIIPIYNSEDYLFKCLESVVNQTYKNLEIILINDGSTDNSEKICKEFACKDKRICLISKENTGVSNSRNVGIKYATGDYISFIDSDDYLDLYMYENIIEIISNHANIDTVLMDINVVWDESKIQDKKNINTKTVLLTREEAFNNITCGLNFQGYSPSKLYSTRIIKNNDLQFDEKIFMAEDLLFFVEYLYFANNIIYTPNSYYNYIKHGDNFTLNYSPKRLTIINAYEKIINKIESINGVIVNNFYSQYFDQVFGLLMRLEAIHAPSKERVEAYRSICAIPFIKLNKFSQKVKKYLLEKKPKMIFKLWNIKNRYIFRNRKNVLKEKGIYEK